MSLPSIRVKLGFQNMNVTDDQWKRNCYDDTGRVIEWLSEYVSQSFSEYNCLSFKRACLIRVLNNLYMSEFFYFDMLWSEFCKDFIMTQGPSFKWVISDLSFCLIMLSEVLKVLCSPNFKQHKEGSECLHYVRVLTQHECPTFISKCGPSFVELL